MNQSHKNELLLEHFYRTHDPTTLNRQGADTGTREFLFFCPFFNRAPPLSIMYTHKLL